MNNTH